MVVAGDVSYIIYIDGRYAFSGPAVRVHSHPRVNADSINRHVRMHRTLQLFINSGPTPQPTRANNITNYICIIIIYTQCPPITLSVCICMCVCVCACLPISPLIIYIYPQIASASLTRILCPSKTARSLLGPDDNILQYYYSIHIILLSSPLPP